MAVGQGENKITEAVEVFCVLVWGFMLLTPLVPVAYSWRNWQNVRHSTLLQGPQTITVGKDGIAIVSEVTCAQCRWATFIKVVETDRSILFYVTASNMVALPLRALPDPDDRRELRQRLRAGMGDKAQLRRKNRGASSPRQRIGARVGEPDHSRLDDAFGDVRHRTVAPTFTYTTWDVFRTAYANMHRRPAIWLAYVFARSRSWRRWHFAPFPPLTNSERTISYPWSSAIVSGQLRVHGRFGFHRHSSNGMVGQSGSSSTTVCNRFRTLRRPRGGHHHNHGGGPLAPEMAGIRQGS